MTEPKDKEYLLPSGIVTALQTERTELLKLVKSEDFSNGDVRELLVDLIEDRRELGQKLAKLKMRYNNVLGNLRKAVEELEIFE